MQIYARNSCCQFICDGFPRPASTALICLSSLRGEPAPSGDPEASDHRQSEAYPAAPAGRGAAACSENAIDVPDPLGDQHLALAAEAVAVLFLGSCVP